jgi:hypothetical protein
VHADRATHANLAPESRGDFRGDEAVIKGAENGFKAESKRSTDLCCVRSAASCCRLGASRPDASGALPPPGFCSSSRIQEKLSVVSCQSSVVSIQQSVLSLEAITDQRSTLGAHRSRAKRGRAFTEYW